MIRLNIRAFCFSFAIAFAIFILFIGWCGAFGWGVGFIKTWSSVYIGYAPTFVGGIIGFFWGLLDGGVAGLLVSFLYNSIAFPKRKINKGKK